MMPSGLCAALRLDAELWMMAAAEWILAREEAAAVADAKRCSTSGSAELRSGLSDDRFRDNKDALARLLPGTLSITFMACNNSSNHDNNNNKAVLPNAIRGRLVAYIMLAGERVPC